MSRIINLLRVAYFREKKITFLHNWRKLQAIYVKRLVFSTKVERYSFPKLGNMYEGTSSAFQLYRKNCFRCGE